MILPLVPFSMFYPSLTRGRFCSRSSARLSLTGPIAAYRGQTLGFHTIYNAALSDEMEYERGRNGHELEIRLPHMRIRYEYFRTRDIKIEQNTPHALTRLNTLINLISINYSYFLFNKYSILLKKKHE